MIKNQIRHQSREVQDYQSARVNAGSPAYYQNDHQRKRDIKDILRMAELMAEASFMEKDHSADMKPTILNLKKIKIKGRRVGRIRNKTIIRKEGSVCSYLHQLTPTGRYSMMVMSPNMI